MDNIIVRKFEKKDIPKKIEWINNPLNNRYLHYELPLEYKKTCQWYEKNKDKENRYDAIIEKNGEPVGLIGLLKIDYANKQAEYYITLGEQHAKGAGIAYQASKIVLKKAFEEYDLKKVYLYTEIDNISAQRLFFKIGFNLKKRLDNEFDYCGKSISRYYYEITNKEYLRGLVTTPVLELGEWENNRLYIKREDLLPFSFGGNKARKAELFFDEILNGEYNHIITYGSSSSNHCRVISNMAAKYNLPCTIIEPIEASKSTFNKKLMRAFGANFISVPVNDVHETIQQAINDLKVQGEKPYFIQGGGHGNIGTQAYVDCYREILNQEVMMSRKSDYIFFASGTGTTQAGLVCGKILSHDAKSVIGISIARQNPRGGDIVRKSCEEYLKEAGFIFDDNCIEKTVTFEDTYCKKGYADSDDEIESTCISVLARYGVSLDPTYTGKAFAGMKSYIKKYNIRNKNILFIHTGGTPLFFDLLNEEKFRG